MECRTPRFGHQIMGLAWRGNALVGSQRRCKFGGRSSRSSSQSANAARRAGEGPCHFLRSLRCLNILYTVSESQNSKKRVRPLFSCFQNAWLCSHSAIKSRLLQCGSALQADAAKQVLAQDARRHKKRFKLQGQVKPKIFNTESV